VGSRRRRRIYLSLSARGASPPPGSKSGRDCRRRARPREGGEGRGRAPSQKEHPARHGCDPCPAGVALAERRARETSRAPKATPPLDVSGGGVFCERWLDSARLTGADPVCGGPVRAGPCGPALPGHTSRDRATRLAPTSHCAPGLCAIRGASRLEPPGSRLDGPSSTLLASSSPRCAQRVSDVLFFPARADNALVTVHDRRRHVIGLVTYRHIREYGEIDHIGRHQPALDRQTSRQRHGVARSSGRGRPRTAGTRRGARSAPALRGGRARRGPPRPAPMRPTPGDRAP
jgi:hypothetical protein